MKSKTDNHFGLSVLQLVLEDNYTEYGTAQEVQEDT